MLQSSHTNTACSIPLNIIYPKVWIFIFFAGQTCLLARVLGESNCNVQKFEMAEAEFRIICCVRPKETLSLTFSTEGILFNLFAIPPPPR